VNECEQCRGDDNGTQVGHTPPETLEKQSSVEELLSQRRSHRNNQRQNHNVEWSIDTVDQRFGCCPRIDIGELEDRPIHHGQHEHLERHPDRQPNGDVTGNNSGPKICDRSIAQKMRHRNGSGGVDEERHQRARADEPNRAGVRKFAAEEDPDEHQLPDGEEHHMHRPEHNRFFRAPAARPG